MNFFDQPTKPSDVAFQQLLVDIYDALHQRAEVLEKQGVSRSEIARRMGKNRSTVSRLLNGRANLTLQSLAELATAMEFRVGMSLKPYEAYNNVSVRVDSVKPVSNQQANTIVMVDGQSCPGNATS